MKKLYCNRLAIIGGVLIAGLASNASVSCAADLIWPQAQENLDGILNSDTLKPLFEDSSLGEVFAKTIDSSQKPLTLAQVINPDSASNAAVSFKNTLGVDSLDRSAQRTLDSNVHFDSSVFKAGGSESQAQVTSVSQLSDVFPTDWAFQAVQSLVERYGCIAGYPDGTFRGNRPATRYELAAALNACLDQISDRFATKEDLDAVKALQEEFAAELATLRGRVDGLEARTATLEAQQFSTTTKLAGEVIFSLNRTSIGNSNGLTSNRPVPSGFAPGTSEPLPGDQRFALNYRATLNFITSFTGKDLLITSLQQGNFSQTIFGGGTFGAFPSGGFSGLLAPQVAQANGDNNNLGIFSLQYRFPVLNDKGTISAIAIGGELSDFVDTLNPYFDSDGQGALSAFGLRNPIYRQVNNVQGSQFTGTGIGFGYDFNDKVNFSLGYLAPGVDAADPTDNLGGADNTGLFGGDYGAIAQLTYKPSDKVGVGLTYIRSSTDSPVVVGFGGLTGTSRANAPFGVTETTADTVGLQFTWQPVDSFALSGWAGATFAFANDAGSAAPVINNVAPGDTATVVNFALNAAFPDLFGEGNLGGIIVGLEPQVVSSSIPGNTDPDANIHLEALYRFQVNENISVTPGVIVVLNPEGNSFNDPVIVGTLRTTFSF